MGLHHHVHFEDGKTEELKVKQLTWSHSRKVPEPGVSQNRLASESVPWTSVLSCISLWSHHTEQMNGHFFWLGEAR